jgi:hypothetical protein
MQSEIVQTPVKPFAGIIVGRDEKPITVEQGQTMLHRIEQWPHWQYIGDVAKKEYRLSAERFSELLPEYQKFMCLMLLGVKGLGMFNADIDNIWHAHILATLRYQEFYEQYNHGQMIHHLPQLKAKSNNICTVCKSCKDCSTPHLVPHESSDDPMYFAQAYIQAFGHAPTHHWNLSRFPGYHNALLSVSPIATHN